MFTVTKRNGKQADFELGKISNAIKKAFTATGTQFTDDILELLALRVSADIQKKIQDGTVHVEDIQDSAEKVLEQSGYTDVAKAYILYRKQREKLRNVKNTLLDYKDVVDKYMKSMDWRVKENSTVTYSIGGLILNNSGAITANYWLSEVYDDEVANAHRNADIHIHDLSMLSGYCAGWRRGSGGIQAVEDVVFFESLERIQPFDFGRQNVRGGEGSGFISQNRGQGKWSGSGEGVAGKEQPFLCFFQRQDGMILFGRAGTCPAGAGGKGYFRMKAAGVEKKTGIFQAEIPCASQHDQFHKIRHKVLHSPVRVSRYRMEYRFVQKSAVNVVCAPSFVQVIERAPPFPQCPMEISPPNAG